jgi:hypothetical protein
LPTKVHLLSSLRKIAQIFILLLLPFAGFADQRYTLSGYLRDAKSGEALISASIYDKSGTNGTFTNEYGFFSISLPKGTHRLVFSYIGYLTKEADLVLEKNTQQNYSLAPQNVSLEAVTIKGGKENSLRESELGALHLNVKELNQLPVLFGEQDILKSIQLMPGVVPAGEGNSAFHVRSILIRT